MSEATRSVDRALDILLCFSINTPELSMTQIAERTSMNKSTVHRLLATLEAKRFVERDQSTSLYRPGNRFLQMAFLTLERDNLRNVASPFLMNLSELFEETITLSIIDETDVVNIFVLESPQRVKVSAHLGQRISICCSAAGQAILAYASKEVVEKVNEQIITRNSKPLLNVMEGMSHLLELIRERGFACSDEENESDVNSIASPILDARMRPLAAITLSGPAYRLPRNRLLEIGPTITETARRITAEYLTTRLIR